MRPIQPRNWRSEDFTAELTGEVAPPASASLLALADAWLVDAAIQPYCGTAHVFDGQTTGLTARHLAAIIAPAAVHARVALTRTWTGYVGGTTYYHELWSSDGGTTGNDVIRVPWYHTPSWGWPTPTWQYGSSEIVVSGESIIDAPAPAPALPPDRMLELQTLGAPYVEPLYVTAASGYSLCVCDLVANLETL